MPVKAPAKCAAWTGMKPVVAKNVLSQAHSAMVFSRIPAMARYANGLMCLKRFQANKMNRQHPMPDRPP